MFPEEQDCDLDCFITSNRSMVMKNHNLRNRGKEKVVDLWEMEIMEKSKHKINNINYQVSRIA